MDIYLHLAKEALVGFLKDPNIIFKYPAYLTADLKHKKSGVFVSLHYNNELRGCVGTYESTQENLALEIVANAISAGFHDPRFKPVTENELPNIQITVDILSPLEKINSVTELDPKKYGIMVIKNKKKAILLPDLQGLSTIEQQVDAVLKKADIKDGVYGCNLYRFTTERHW